MDKSIAPNSTADKIEAKSIDRPDLGLAPVPIPIQIRKLTDSEVSSLITASLFVPIHLAQLSEESLSKYNLIEILPAWKSALTDPPDLKLSKPLIEFPYSHEEDYILMLYLRLGRPGTLQEYVSSFSSSFKLGRTIDSLEARLEFLCSLPEEKKSAIISDFTDDLLAEEISSLSPGNTSPLPLVTDAPISPSVDSQIEDLLTEMGAVLPNAISRSDLAIFRTEKLEFSMKRSRITIGRSWDDNMVDIDLRFIKPAKTYSRIQAVVSLLEDCNFYLENPGSCAMYVNGIEIPPNGVCKLPLGAIIDIDDVLLMFFPNERIVQKLKNSASRAGRKKTGQKAHSKEKKQ